MSAGELGSLVIAAASLWLSSAFAALVVVLHARARHAAGDVRRELDDLRGRDDPPILRSCRTPPPSRATVDEARADLDRFDRVLGSAEAISDAVGHGSTSFSTPMIKAAGLARGTSTPGPTSAAGSPASPRRQRRAH